MLIPRVGSEVTLEWLQTVLENYERKSNPSCSFSVLDFDIKKGTQPGENFNSDIDVIEVKGQLKQGGQVEEKSFFLLLKFLSTNIFSREANRFSNNHVRELLLYSELFNKLNSLQEKECEGKHPLNIPKLYYSHNIKDDYVLVMENLKFNGYITNDKKKGLDIHQLDLAFIQIARWHALSYVYDKRFNLLKEFPEFAFNSQTFRMVSYILDTGLKNVLPLVKGKEEFKDIEQHLLKKRNGLLQSFRQQTCETVEEKNCIKCLVHGDFWNNNIMYQYINRFPGEDNRPSDIKLLDWQMCHIDRPVIDLHYILHSSTTYEVRKTYTDRLLRLYYSTFEIITSSLGCPIAGFTYENFRKDYDAAALVGFLFGICLAQGTLSESGKNINNQSPSTVSVRDFSFSLKSNITRKLMALASSPHLSFVVKKMSSKLLSPIGVEIREGKNEILNSRLLELIQEAKDIGTFNNIDIN